MKLRQQTQMLLIFSLVAHCLVFTSAYGWDGSPSQGLAPDASLETRFSTRKESKTPSSRWLEDLVKNSIFPLNGSKDRPEHKKTREQIMRELEATQQKLATIDGALLDSLWSPGPPDSPAVILFHGNGSILDGMEGYARWYRSRGFRTLLVTIRGYPGSTGDAVEAGELGIFYDVEAALNFVVNLLQVPPGKVLVHGFSLGGAYVATAGRYFGVATALDHVFTNAEDVVVNYTGLPEFIIGPVVRDAFPDGISTSVRHVRIPVKTEHFVTDGLSNLKKAGRTEKDLFVFFGSNDPMTPKEFAEEILAAKYADASKRAARSAEIPGEHWGPFFEHPDATAKFEAFLRDNGLLR